MGHKRQVGGAIHHPLGLTGLGAGAASWAEAARRSAPTRASGGRASLGGGDGRWRGERLSSGYVCGTVTLSLLSLYFDVGKDTNGNGGRCLGAWWDGEHPPASWPVRITFDPWAIWGSATDCCVTLSKSFPSLSRFLIRKTGGPPSCRELCPGSFYVSFSSGCHRPWWGSEPGCPPHPSQW